jgi:predicted outer membrane repeat protein
VKQLDTTQKEQEVKHTSLDYSHDTFIASERNPTRYTPKILASMGTGHPYDVLLQDQEPPGNDHTSFNSRNSILPTKQMTRLYSNAAGVTERAGHPAAAEFLRLSDPALIKHDLLQQKIGRALRDVSNSKERAGHRGEILLQAGDGGGADDDGNGGGDDVGGGDSAGREGGGGDGDGDDDVLPSATNAPSVTVLPSITDASSPTKMWVANTTAVASMRRRLTAVSNWEAMKTACGSSGTVTLSDDFVMGRYTPTPPSPLYGGIDFSRKQLVIIGNNKVLDAGEKGRFFFGSGIGSSLEVRNLKMRNGKMSVTISEKNRLRGWHSGVLDGGAIFIRDGTLAIHDSTFDTNSATTASDGDGGAIFANYADVKIYTSIFESNTNIGDGGAIYFQDDITTRTPLSSMIQPSTPTLLAAMVEPFMLG